MVYSPITIARVRNELLNTATFRLGKIIWNMMVNQFAPKLCAASVKDFTSIAARPTSMERYTKGRAKTTYPATSNT